MYYTYLVWHNYLSQLLYLPMQSPLPTVVFYVYTVLNVYGQNCIVFYTLLLSLRILAAVPTQSPLPTMVFYVYTVPVSMDRIVQSSMPLPNPTAVPTPLIYPVSSAYYNLLCLHSPLFLCTELTYPVINQT